MTASPTLRSVDILVRVSTEEQTAGTSPEDQEEKCRQKARELNLTVHRVLYEPGVSGRRYQSRPHLMSAIEDIEHGHAQALLCWKIDRIGRSAEVIHRVSKRIDRAGGVIMTCEGIEFGRSAIGHLMLALLAMLAQFERDMIIERTHGQKLNAARQGRQMSRATSRFGYTITTKAIADAATPAGSYQLHPQNSQIVRDMFLAYAHGQSARAIGRMLQDRKITSPRGNVEWSTRTIVGILRDPIYIGKAYYNRHEYRRGEQESGDYKLTVNERPRHEWIEIPAPPIVEEVLYARVQGLLDTAVQERSGHQRHDYLLTGLVRCPVCGTRMHGQTQTHRNNYRSYVCNREAACRYKSVPAEKLEAAVIAVVRDAATHPERIEIEVEAMQAIRRAKQDAGYGNRDALEAELRDLEVREKATAAAQVDAIVHDRNPAPYDALLSELTERRRTLIVALSTIPSYDTSGYDVTLLKEIVAALDEVFAEGSHATTSEKRELLSTVIEQVNGDLEDPRVVWKVGV